MCRRRQDVRRAGRLALAGLAVLLLTCPRPARAAGAIRSARVSPPDRLELVLTTPGARLRPENVRVADLRAPDVPLTVTRVDVRDGTRVTLTVVESVARTESYTVTVREPSGAATARPSRWGLWLSAFLAAALINNFVFTRYLGLCIFFGVSKKRDTAWGMGLTFTLVMLAAGMISWALYRYVLAPLHLAFLEVVVFIGVVAFLVQILDTVLKKVRPGLYRRFGIYLVLITTNCIILAVPLLNAQADANAGDALLLALGSGVGFALALLLMSTVREKVEMARVPRSLEGLPIAFALAGSFALAFLGFAGLDLFR